MQDLLREFVFALNHVDRGAGVNLDDVEDFIRHIHGRTAIPIYRKALKEAVNEGFLTVKQRRLFPTAYTTMPLLEPRRKIRKRNYALDLLIAKRRRDGGRHCRRRRYDVSDIEDWLETRKRRRRRGWRHDDAGEFTVTKSYPDRKWIGRSKPRWRGRSKRRCTDTLSSRRRHDGSEQAMSAQGPDSVQTDVNTASKDKDIKPLSSEKNQ